MLNSLQPNFRIWVVLTCIITIAALLVIALLYLHGFHWYNLAWLLGGMTGVIASMAVYLLFKLFKKNIETQHRAFIQLAFGLSCLFTLGFQIWGVGDFLGTLFFFFLAQFFYVWIMIAPQFLRLYLTLLAIISLLGCLGLTVSDIYQAKLKSHDGLYNKQCCKP